MIRIFFLFTKPMLLHGNDLFVCLPIVIGTEHDGVLLTLVERVTKYVFIVKLPSKNDLYLANQAVKHLLKCPLPVGSITFDNGKEFTQHRHINEGLKRAVYFA